MSKWWPTISVVIGSLVTAFTPTVQGVLAHHPTASAILGGVLGIVLHFMPAPTQQP